MYILFSTFYFLLSRFMKYIFVVGGVMSGVGKGTATASLGRLLVANGFKVTAVKIDPYVNIDAGTMNPVEHGEVFVTNDGDETDQDIGIYERFLDTTITSINYMTTGRVYQEVIGRERALGYNGHCVDVVPDVPEEVIRRIKRAGQKAKADFVMIEVGGTVGEYQNVLFLEAIRMMRLKDPSSVLLILVSYLPIPSKVGEMKTKPTQYAVRTINGAGLQPDMIIGRASEPIDKIRKEKLARSCNMAKENIISAPDIDSVYEIPINFEKEHLTERVLAFFKMKSRRQNGLLDWKKMVKIVHKEKPKVNLAIVGKYWSTGDFVLSDVYISVIEAVKHAAWASGVEPELHWLNAEELEKSPKAVASLKSFDGVIVPGGFGSRGINGKIKAIEFARKNNIPYLGLCYGMQLAVVEFARNVLRWPDANTTEINPKTKKPVIHIMDSQKDKVAAHEMGGTMRLGAYPCVLKSGTVAAKAYGARRISERHRHRYEFNNAYRAQLEKKGLVVSGTSPDNTLVEIVELKNHPFFVGTQFHPEFQSSPLRPHPLFKSFIAAAKKKH